MARRAWLLLVALSLPSCEIIAGLTGSRDGPLSGRAGSGFAAGTAGTLVAGAGQAGHHAAGSAGGAGKGAGTAGRGRGGAGGAKAGAAGSGGKTEPAGGESGSDQGGAGEGGASNGARAGTGGFGAAGSGGAAGRAGAGGASAGAAGGGQAGGLSIGGRPALAASSCSAEPTCTTDSACTTLPVPGGPFAMGRGEAGAPDAYEGASNEVPEHAVTVSPFWLDKYEVTVARFRQFVQSYDGKPPADGAGNHPRIMASGWHEEWNDQLPKSRTDLETLLLAPDQHCNSSYRTWTKVAGNTECLPINCIDWYVSYAFCIWDGGRLPTEAEWEFAAAGGDENNLYPWGSEAPDATRAVFGCGSSCTPGDIRPIGTTTSAGYGRYGQADLAGSMLERTRDVMDPAYYTLQDAAGTDVLDLALDSTLVDGVARGGNYLRDPATLRAATRDTVFRSSRWDGVGIRCARNP